MSEQRGSDFGMAFLIGAVSMLVLRVLWFLTKVTVRLLRIVFAFVCTRTARALAAWNARRASERSEAALVSLQRSEGSADVGIVTEPPPAPPALSLFGYSGGDGHGALVAPVASTSVHESAGGGVAATVVPVAIVVSQEHGDLVPANRSWGQVGLAEVH